MYSTIVLVFRMYKKYLKEGTNKVLYLYINYLYSFLNLLINKQRYLYVITLKKSS